MGKDRFVLESESITPVGYHGKFNVSALSGFPKLSSISVFLLLVPVCARATTRDFEIDPTFGVPIPPIGAYYDPVLSNYVLWVIGILGVIITAFSLFDCVKKKSLVPIMLSFGVIACIVPEVYIDIMSGCYWTNTPETTAFTIQGRAMPWFSVVAWYFLGNVMIYGIYKIISRRAATKWLWGVFLLVCALDILCENSALSVHDLYLYYGNQPLWIGKLPLWFAPSNAGGMFLAAALAYRYEHRLRGWRSLSLIFLTPMSLGGFYAFVSLPAWIVVNGRYSWLLTQGAGLLTVAMGFTAVAMTIHLVLRRDPYDLAGGERSSPKDGASGDVETRLASEELPQ